ncbi:MAG: hypothetical protein FJ318_03100 [SAR202 cluster bacterium]|nr:hypothetical protein [SAR202 cluster bacterium]
MTPLARDYLLLVFISAVGILQLAAANADLRGLLLLRPWPRTSRWLGTALVVGSFAWFFFGGTPRNLPDTAGGLDGNAQARWFVVGTLGAAVFTAIVTSIVNARWGIDDGWDPGHSPSPPAGLTWLRRTTFLRAFGARMRWLARRGA